LILSPSFLPLLSICDPILEKMVKGEEEKNEFLRVLIENAFKRRLNEFHKRLNEFQKR